MAAPGATVEELGGADEAHADYARAARRDRTFGLVKGGAAYLVLIVFALIAVLPFIYLLSPSLRQSFELFTYPPQWIPDTLYWATRDRPERDELLPLGPSTRSSSRPP